MTTGEIVIDKSLVILGNGVENTMIESNGNSRIFNINSGTIVVISDVTIANGGGVDLGGGIFSEGISLSLDNVLLEGNTANLSGGGLFVMGSEVTIFNSILRSNSGNGDALTDGGGGFTNDGGCNCFRR